MLSRQRVDLVRLVVKQIDQLHHSSLLSGYLASGTDFETKLTLYETVGGNVAFRFYVVMIVDIMGLWPLSGQDNAH